MFSKYDVYTTTESVYCYPGTNILRNKLGIKDAVLLRRAEEEITAVKQFEMLENPIHGHFSKTQLMNIHKFLFEDIYYFAGKIRREQISKADTRFYPPDLINRELDKVFSKIKADNMTNEKNIDKVYDNLAYVMAELNIIHPFREGNGRAIREFIRLLAQKCGININWGNVNREEVIEASIQSVYQYEQLIPILTKATQKDT